MTTRREFMVGAAGLTFTVLMDGCAALRTQERGAAALAPAPGPGSVKVNAWASLSTDGTIYIANPAVEMGQGSQTAIPLIIAEEMDADWSRVRIVPAAADDKVYGNPGFRRLMYTAGSATVTGYWDVARTFGAQVRRVLMENAADKWGVPLAEVSTEPSVVVHAKTGRRISYGEIAAFARIPATAPAIKPEELKKPEQYRLIGKDVMRVELPSKVNGTAQYSIDVQLPGNADRGENLRERVCLRLHLPRADGAAQLGRIGLARGRRLRDLVRHPVADHGGGGSRQGARHPGGEGEIEFDLARRRVRAARASRRGVRRRLGAALEGGEAAGESAVDARGRRAQRTLSPALGAFPARGARRIGPHRRMAAPRRLRRDHRVPGSAALQGGR